MTRSFNERIRCPQCGNDHTVETDFERWVRGHEELDSRKNSLVRFDLDMLLHRYKIDIGDGKGTRNVQCMMFVEVKTHMADLSASQADTLWILDQVMRNRRCNVHSKPRKQIESQITRAFSKTIGRDVRIMLYGGHLLQLDGTSPDNSQVILWDRQKINQSMLLELMRFERDPDRIRILIDHRRRSKNWTEAPLLPIFRFPITE